jgi:hypothetical protein
MIHAGYSEDIREWTTTRQIVLRRVCIDDQPDGEDAKSVRKILKDSTGVI